MRRAIDWFARNGVAANLLMVLVVAGGILTLPSIRRETFPEFSSDAVSVSVEYIGAAPDEVEESICMRVEEAVNGLAGIKRVVSTAREGMGSVLIEALTDYDIRKLRDEVETRVDSIDTFPEEAEEPVVQQVTVRRQVINVAVYGETDESTLRTVADRVRDDISQIPGISLVELSNARPHEISIEVSEEALRAWGLTFDEVARAIRATSLDLPGGTVKTEGGEVLVRTKGQAYRGPEFERIALRSFPDGTRVLLADVAKVIDGFADTDQITRFDGHPAILVRVSRVGEQNVLDISADVREWVERQQGRLPEGIRVETWQDEARILRSRLDLLLRNGRMGFVLVFLSLALFLRLKLAVWVAFGIPVSFLGTLWMLPAVDVSINLISLFAFIVALGIVVDDAIVIGENIYTYQQRGLDGLAAATRGAKEVGVPVVFAVLTTVAAFTPLLIVPGNIGKIMKVIPTVVILILLFSLAESLFVLPNHLSHFRAPTRPRKRHEGILGLWARFRDGFTGGLDFVIEKLYRPTLDLAVRWRYSTLALGVASLLLMGGVVAGGWVRFVFFPPVDADNVVALLTMPAGTTAEATSRAVEQLERAAHQVQAEVNREHAGEFDDVFVHMLSSVGGQPYRETQNRNAGRSASFSGAHLGEVNIELLPSEKRNLSSTVLADRWRELTGSIPEALELTFTSSIFSSGDEINIQLASTDLEDLRVAAAELEKKLYEYAGVIDIADSFRAGKREIQLEVRPEGERLGIDQLTLARQVRQGFYGEEAQRIQRGRDDVKVMVRYPREARRSLDRLEDMRIRAPDGTEVPFSAVAKAREGRGYATIERADRKRVVNVTAGVDFAVGNVSEVMDSLRAGFLPDLLERHDGLSYSLEGQQRDQVETMAGLREGFVLALLAIYALLAIPFRSYFQPLIVMSAIPFGFVGAILGHILLGLEVTLLSMFGLVALMGVIVNDSLVMVDFINRHRTEGGSLLEVVKRSGAARFRPILLTSLTTFAGLTPLLLEKSMQAKFLIPMAVSLGFGVMFATAVTLVLVPVLYYILEDGRRLFHRKDHGPEPGGAAALEPNDATAEPASTSTIG